MSLKFIVLLFKRLDSILCLFLMTLADIWGMNTFFWVNLDIEYIVFKCLDKTGMVVFLEDAKKEAYLVSCWKFLDHQGWIN